MKNKITSFFYYLFLIAVFSGSFASTSWAYDETIIIRYVNGINNSKESVADVHQNLSLAYLNKFKQEYPNKNIIIDNDDYNPSNGFFKDVLEVASQKLNEFGLNNKLIPAQVAIILERDPKLPTKRFIELAGFEVSANFVESVLAKYNAYTAARLTKKETLTKLLDVTTKEVDLYNEVVYSPNQGELRVLLLAHSQGNLYANDMVKTLRAGMPKDIKPCKLGIIGLGSPASLKPEATTYYTAQDDFVINAARQIISNILPGNLNNNIGPGDDRDLLKHNFLRSYFKIGLPSRAKIDKDIKYFIDGNTCETDDEKINVRLGKHSISQCAYDTYASDNGTPLALSTTGMQADTLVTKYEKLKYEYRFHGCTFDSFYAQTFYKNAPPGYATFSAAGPFQVKNFLLPKPANGSYGTMKYTLPSYNEL